LVHAMSMPRFMLSLLICRLDAKGSGAAEVAPLLIKGFVPPPTGSDALRDGTAVGNGNGGAAVCVYTAWSSGIVAGCAGRFASDVAALWGI